MKRICGGLTIAGRFLNPLLMLPSLHVAGNSQAVFIKMSGDPVTYGEVPHRSFRLSPERSRFHRSSVLQPAGREEAPVLLASCFLSVLSSLTVTDILWHNRHHDLGDHQS